MIRKEGSKWILYSADGSKVLGRFDSEADAKERERQIIAAKRAKEAFAEIPELCLFEHEPGRDRYDEKALDAVVANFSGEGTQGRIKTELGEDLDNPMVVLGHDEEQKLLKDSGLPAAGWISKVWRDGRRLMGAITDIPEVVADLISRKAYRKHSAEFYRDYNGLGPALRRLALLGGDIPAKKTLGDLAVQTYSENGLDIDVFSAYHVETEEGEHTMTIEELKKQNEELSGQLASAKAELEKAAVRVKAAEEKLADLEKEEGAGDDKGDERFAELNKQVDALRHLVEERGKKVKELETKRLESEVDAWAERVRREKGIYSDDAIKDLKARAMAFATDTFAEGKTPVASFMEAIETHLPKTVVAGTSQVRGVLTSEPDEASEKKEYDAWAESQNEATLKTCTFEWWKKNIS